MRVCRGAATWSRTAWGLRLLLDLDNVVDQQVFLTGTWEKGTIDTLLGLTREERQHHGGEAVFVDIGAHWGLYALLAHQSGMFDRIVAFEPDPMNYAQLQANLFLNGATTAIEALQLATSDRERTFGLSLATRSQSRRHARGRGRAGEPGHLPRVRVDQELDFSGKLLVIKMDVEGHEMEAIDGLLGLLAKNRCVLQLEIWSTTRGGDARDGWRCSRRCSRATASSSCARSSPTTFLCRSRAR